MKFILASAFVQLVGLVMMHDHPKAGVRAILPNVQHHTEEHRAIVAFRTPDLVSSTGWIAKDLTPAAGGKYSYVELHGEHISFEVTGGRNERATVPKALPSLSRSCRAMTSLNPGYLPPYPLASAVVLIPVGTLNACRAPAANVDGRIDTTLVLSGKGNFKVTAPGKSLTFRPDTTLIVGNVPASWLEKKAGSSSAPHSDAYFAMGLSMSQAAMAKCKLQRVQGVPNCESAEIRQIANAVGTPFVVPEIFLHMLSYECSNTQWP